MSEIYLGLILLTALQVWNILVQRNYKICWGFVEGKFVSSESILILTFYELKVILLVILSRALQEYSLVLKNENFESSHCSRNNYSIPHNIWTVRSKSLKELQNHISRIICLWSLFCSILVYASLHFLPIPLEN